MQVFSRLFRTLPISQKSRMERNLLFLLSALQLNQISDQIISAVKTWNSKNSLGIAWNSENALGVAKMLLTAITRLLE